MRKLVRVLVTICALALWDCAREVNGQAAMILPPARGAMWAHLGNAAYADRLKPDFDYPYHHDCNGRYTTETTFRSLCSPCGDYIDFLNPSNPRPNEDPNLYAIGEIVYLYHEGQTINVTLDVRTHMAGGVYRFTLCQTDSSLRVTHSCFQHPLTWEDTGSAIIPAPLQDGHATYTLKLPDGLVCDYCVLQWKWSDGYYTCRTVNGERICGPTITNCADVRITEANEPFPADFDWPRYDEYASIYSANDAENEDHSNHTDQSTTPATGPIVSIITFPPVTSPSTGSSSTSGVSTSSPATSPSTETTSSEATEPTTPAPANRLLDPVVPAVAGTAGLASFLGGNRAVGGALLAAAVAFGLPYIIGGKTRAVQNLVAQPLQPVPIGPTALPTTYVAPINTLSSTQWYGTGLVPASNPYTMFSPAYTGYVAPLPPTVITSAPAAQTQTVVAATPRIGWNSINTGSTVQVVPSTQAIQTAVPIPPTTVQRFLRPVPTIVEVQNNIPRSLVPSAPLNQAPFHQIPSGINNGQVTILRSPEQPWSNQPDVYRQPISVEFPRQSVANGRIPDVVRVPPQYQTMARPTFTGSLNNQQQIVVTGSRPNGPQTTTFNNQFGVHIPVNSIPTQTNTQIVNQPFYNGVSGTAPQQQFNTNVGLAGQQSSFVNGGRAQTWTNDPQVGYQTNNAQLMTGNVNIQPSGGNTVLVTEQGAPLSPTNGEIIIVDSGLNTAAGGCKCRARYAIFTLQCMTFDGDQNTCLSNGDMCYCDAQF